ncbi:MAG: methylated-DNA--[protein]-cysteine S-methyltransferase [Eubacteriales bacterium]|nr:methylated-DNA--[protein]-cysteine S-methyltransferase [Eubacteriales bacterium]MDD4461490.1 methylated-DNA--[protein]-cysteine S-methyltransferase [Eubacteriales bacterium]
MSDHELRIQPLRIADAARLRGCPGFDADRPLADISGQLRTFIGRCDGDAWLVHDGSPDEKILLAAGFQRLPGFSRHALLVILSIFPEQSADQGLRAMIRQALTDSQYYSLEWRLDQGAQERMQMILSADGWQFVASINQSDPQEGIQKQQTVMIYVLYRPCYPSFGYAVVPFEKGLFAILGGQDAIVSADFVHERQPAKDDWLQETLNMLELTDETGRLLPVDELRRKTDERGVIHSQLTPAAPVAAARQAAEYFAGRRFDFDLPVQLEAAGSSFQNTVWRQLSEIPYGQTRSYSDLARRIRPDDEQAGRTLARAVGHACGANPLPLIVPCHRVIGNDGRLTGFSSGIEIKEYLLNHEFAWLAESGHQGSEEA